MLRIAPGVLLLICLVVPDLHAQQTKTLAEILKQDSIPVAAPAIPNLNSPITSYATLNDEREFIIAYYLANSGDELRFPLFLTRLEKQNGTWKQRAFAALTMANALPATETNLQGQCLGSVLGIQSDGNRYYLSLHLTPSAVCLLILTHDLTVDQTLGGWPDSFFKSGLLVYHGNMVQFADVHPETLFLYQPETHKSIQLYPPNNDPLRRDFSERLSEVIDPKQCRINNWLCAPDRFTSTTSAVEVNDRTSALAFRVSFETEGFLTREEADSSGKWDDDEYVYVYQLDPIRWREFSVYDLKPKFGTDSLKELLTPAKLKEVFAVPEAIPSASHRSH